MDLFCLLFNQKLAGQEKMAKLRIALIASILIIGVAAKFSGGFCWKHVCGSFELGGC
jgi:hypothetical protein